MTYKNIKFSESDVMKEFEKIALDKKIIQPEIKKKASKIEISANLDVNICNLINKLSESGNFSLAEEVRSNFLEYKKAQVEDAKNELKMKKLASEVTNDMKKFYDSAHPEGSVKMDDDSESVVEDLYDSHDAIMKIVNKVNLKKKANLIKEARNLVEEAMSIVTKLQGSVSQATNKIESRSYSEYSESHSPAEVVQIKHQINDVYSAIYNIKIPHTPLSFINDRYSTKDKILSLISQIDRVRHYYFFKNNKVSDEDKNLIINYIDASISELNKLVLSSEKSKKELEDQKPLTSFEEKLKISRYSLDSEGNYSKFIYKDEDLFDHKKFEDGMHKILVTYKKDKDGSYNKDNATITDYGPVNKKEEKKYDEKMSKQWTDSYFNLKKLYKDNLAWANKQNDPSESDKKSQFMSKLNSLFNDLKGLYSQLENKGDLDAPGNNTIEFNGNLIGKITDVASLRKATQDITKILEVW